MAKAKAQTTTAPSKFASALSGMKTQYNAAHDRYNAMDGENPSDGEHIGRQIEAKLYYNDTKDSLSIIRSFKVTEGVDKGCAVTDFMNLSSDLGLQLAMAYIGTLGYEVPENPEDIEGVIEQINEDRPFCSFRVKNGDFTNVKVLEAFDAADFEDIGTETQTGEGDVETGEDIWSDISEYDKDELLEAMEAEEISLKDIGTSKMKVKKLDADSLRELLAEFLGLDLSEAEEPEEEEEEEEEEEGEEDEELAELIEAIAGMKLKELKEVVEEHELEVEKTKGMKLAEFRDLVIDALSDSEGEEEEEGEEEVDEAELVKLLVAFLVANVEDVESTEDSELDEVKEEVGELLPLAQDDFDDLDEDEQTLLTQVFAEDEDFTLIED